MRVLDASEIESVAGSFPFSELDTFLEGEGIALTGAIAIVGGGVMLTLPGGQLPGAATITLGAGVGLTGDALEVSAVAQWWYG